MNIEPQRKKHVAMLLLPFLENLSTVSNDCWHFFISLCSSKMAASYFVHSRNIPVQQRIVIISDAVDKQIAANDTRVPFLLILQWLVDPSVLPLAPSILRMNDSVCDWPRLHYTGAIWHRCDFYCILMYCLHYAGAKQREKPLR